MTTTTTTTTTHVNPHTYRSSISVLKTHPPTHCLYIVVVLSFPLSSFCSFTFHSTILSLLPSFLPSIPHLFPTNTNTNTFISCLSFPFSLFSTFHLSIHSFLLHAPPSFRLSRWSCGVKFTDEIARVMDSVVMVLVRAGTTWESQGSPNEDISRSEAKDKK